jgi:phosphoribosylamine-glycine ligase
MVEQLRLWQRTGLNPHGEVMLQEFVPGIEMGVSCWMGSSGFIGKPNENFEHKKLMSGDHGPNTGETGTIMSYIDSSKLFTDTLKKMESKLVKMGHLGDTSLNFIVSEEGTPMVLEWTMRFGFPALPIMLVEHEEDQAQWMLDALKGKDTLKVNTEVTAGVLVTIPPFPDTPKDYEKVQSIPVYGVTKKNYKYIQPCDVKIEEHVDDVDGRATYVGFFQYHHRSCDRAGKERKAGM